MWVETGGRKYALNGWAETYLDDDLPLERIWRRGSTTPRVLPCTRHESTPRSAAQADLQRFTYISYVFHM